MVTYNQQNVLREIRFQLNATLLHIVGSSAKGLWQFLEFSLLTHD